MARKNAFLTQYIIKPSLLGFIVAALVLLALPYFQAPTHEPQPTPTQNLISFAEAVELAAPAVVNIYTTQTAPASSRYSRPPTTLRLGSGVIMDRNGFILTAGHVVEAVDNIEVALQDGRVFSAQLIGSDQLTDLAVLQIHADNLSVIPRNDQYQPRVGDLVLAIGNPYNLGQTVTQGIISATGRSDPENAYSEFIQMDAAINEGNSGGALVNSNGELVGINSGRYLSEKGEALTGISFSVTYHLAQKIMAQIISEGKVTRGYFGVEARQVYHPQYQLTGIVLEHIEPGSPADLAQLQTGDFIYQMNDIPLKGLDHALDLIAASRPGTRIEMHFFRKDQKHQTHVTIQPLKPTRSPSKTTRP